MVKENKGKIIDIILVIIIVILASALLFTRCSSNSGDQVTENTGGVQMGIIDMPESKEDIQGRLNEIVEKGMFQIFINTDISIDKQNMADVMIQNSMNNHYDCYVEILYQNEIIYKSDILKPGYKIEFDTIDKFNESGEYDCIAYFHVIDSERNVEVNTIGVDVTVNK